MSVKTDQISANPPKFVVPINSEPKLCEILRILEIPCGILRLKTVNSALILHILPNAAREMSVKTDQISANPPKFVVPINSEPKLCEILVQKLKAPKCTVQVDFESYKQVGLAVIYIKVSRKSTSFLQYSVGFFEFCGNSAIGGIEKFNFERHYAPRLPVDCVSFRSPRKIILRVCTLTHRANQKTNERQWICCIRPEPEACRRMQDNTKKPAVYSTHVYIAAVTCVHS